MTHLNEGIVIAIRDGALVPGDARVHAEECSVCAEALARARQRAEDIAEILGSMTADVDVEAAKASVRARLDELRAAERLRRRWIPSLGRAAALLLVAAGAAYALPGSPVRGWIESTQERLTVDPPVAATSQERVDGSRIEVAVPDEGIHVGLRSVAPGAEVQVVWLDEPVARISAAAGSSYSFAEGRAEAVVTAGDVRLEIFRGARAVSIEINGRMVYEGSSDSPRLLEGVVTRNEDRMIFTIQAP